MAGNQAKSAAQKAKGEAGARKAKEKVKDEFR
jgi:hypothetical protein